uniref:Uncharacterized protein n=1 Tax=Pristionchus pacificus TaxID=54126 RepID=A0A2A6CMS4_PRIPA|eukprot:PDM79545.1 hypothetical protein PRIPAC_32124 [Pristionchus pacificus]
MNRHVCKLIDCREPGLSIRTICCATNPIDGRNMVTPGIIICVQSHIAYRRTDMKNSIENSIEVHAWKS